ncbi:helix-hairpin-helix domain-containing protein [Candidatus Woesebacteria bacterium]|nr:helix-hairpin-helix domain-containing protein [Candidatus Woesebacteria bacterium]
MGKSASTKVEVLSGSTEAETKEFVVEVGGAVEKPGVYKLSSESRVEDALVLSGGLSADADREWVETTLNRAAKIVDGQKIYIPKNGEKSANVGLTTIGETAQNSLINVNTASLKELDTLPGIGPVYGQSIIDHRPYSTPEELISKGAVKQNVYDKIKDKIGVY